MSFLHPNRASKPISYHFILTLVLVLVAYVLVGQLPLIFAYFSLEEQPADIIGAVQESYGLNTTFVLVMLPLVVTFFALYLGVKYIHKWNFLSIVTARERIDFKRILFSFGCWFVFLFGTTFIGFNDLIIWNFKFDNFIILFMLSILIIPIQCAAEEFFFRGYLFQWVGVTVRKPLVAILITGALFGLLHAGNPEVSVLGKVALIYYVWSGFFLGILAQIDQGLELPLGYHIANNLFATLIVTSNWQAFTTDAILLDTNPPSFTVEMMLILLVGQALFVFVFAKIYRWTKAQLFFWK